MKRKILYVFLSLLLLSLLVGVGFFLFFFPIYVKDVSYEVKEKNIRAHISFLTSIEGTCEIEGLVSPIENKKCIIDVPNHLATVTIKTKWNQKEISFNPEIQNIIDFELAEKKIYLAVGEQRSVDISVEKLGNPKIVPIYESENENIVKVTENGFLGVSNGTTNIKVKVGKIEKIVEVIVTDLYHLPVLEPKKQYLKCGVYSEEENRLLDEALAYQVNRAGYKTRAGVVAALRFLTLEFPYQINYFFENGRLNNNTGGAKVDGEGRFYHKGLYLNSYKFPEIQKLPKSYGPVTWGCPLTNWQDESGFKRGVKYPNGLDCSGFITWAFLNGGIFQGDDESKDTGAGDNIERDDDLSDLGPHVLITRELLESKTIKAGDIIATDGHIAMVGGVQDGMVYVAESTTYYHGVVMHPYTYDELLKTDYLTYVIFMDDYYAQNGNGNGNYTDYWD